MDERAKRISEAIEKSGLSYPELERATGISKSSLQRYATGVTKKIPIDCIERIADATNSDARYLMGWEEPQVPASYPTNATPAATSQRRPVQFWGGVAAGVGAYAEGVAVRTMPANDEDMIDGYDYAWLEVEGDSMYPDLQDGDYVLVRVQDTAENGDLIVALIDDGCERLGVVKRLELVEGHHLTLISTNPSYPPRVFVGEQMNDVHIFGIVVSSQRKWH